MNDRFTFRAWNIAQKRYMEDLRLIGFGEINTFREVEEAELDKYGQPQHYTTYEEDEVVLEQCTGLKDKNGKLVYEGDIVKTDDGDVYYITWDEKRGSFIEEDPKDYTIYGAGHHLSLWRDSYKEHYSVIGNIHENPELLKEVRHD